MIALSNLSSTSARVAIPPWPWLLVLVWVAALAALAGVPAHAQGANPIATGVAPVSRLPKGFTEKSAKVNGVRINYQVGGSGPVVVLLHGYTQTSHMWIPLMHREGAELVASGCLNKCIVEGIIHSEEKKA